MIASSYYLQICAFVYIILLSIVFITKKKKKTAENTVFAHLILTVFAGLIFDIAYVYFGYKNPDGFAFKLSFELFLISIVYYILVFTEYVLCIVQYDEDTALKMKKQNILCNKVMLFMIFWSIFIIYIDKFYNSFDGIYSHRLITILTIILIFVCILFWLINLIINRKKLSNNKLAPITMIIILGGIAGIIQYIIPTLHLVIPIFVYSVLILFFTIFPLGNPDFTKMQELEDAKAEADKSNQFKTEYLSNVSHEIRTPLNAILGFSQGMLEENISDEVREEVEDIINASEILLEIVNEILDISKIESNKLEIINVDYSTEKVYNSLVSMTEGRIGSRQLQFIHNFSTKMPQVLYGDYVRIKQIAVNLLTNAIKYTKDGFIKFTFGCELKDNNICQIIISVTDSGIGIKEENIDKIFSKFNGLELQKDINIEGTGLGLSLTKRLVDMMGGKIVVQSKYGEGSTFTVYINQLISSKTLAEIEKEAPVSVNKFLGNGQKILIVDDNAVNLKVALRLMKQFDLNIETAISGQECINKIKEGNHYDLIMLDDMMPEMSGVETLNKLKENLDYNIPTIALTANAISGMKEKYIKDGFSDYLSKPINKALLEDLLVKFLGTKTEAKVEMMLNTESNTETNSEITQEVIDSINNKEEQIEKKEQLDTLKKETQSTNDSIKNKDFLIKNGVDLDKALELLGDMEMYNETVKDFVAEIDTKLADIEKFKLAQDMPNYAILVHSLKSDSKYLGLTKLAELAYNHEMKSKANDINYVNNNYDELMNEARKMVDIVKRYIGS